MEKIIEALWYSYRMENATECNKERKQLMKDLAEKDEFLRTTMSEEQITTLNFYQMHMHQLSELTEKEAFGYGIRFATKYLLDVLYGQ